MKVGYGEMAVSYTHLDVYKRQVLFKSQVNKTPRGSNTKTILLDIYKLRDPEIKEVYRKVIARKLNIVEPQITDMNSNRIEEHWWKINTKIIEMAK